MAKQYWYTQEVIASTVLYGKDYVWMKDVDGTIHLQRLIDGEPQFVVD